jgi:basic membrane protein A
VIPSGITRKASLERTLERTPAPRRVQLRAWALAGLLVLLAGCKRRPEEPPAPPPARPLGAAERPHDSKLVVKVLYAGAKDDGGFNSAQALGVAAIRKLAGVQVIEQENVPEGDDAGLALEQAVSVDGASLIFPTAFGQFDPPVIAAAKQHPGVTYLHCGGLYQEGKHPANAGSYHAYLDEAFYIAGVTAGLTTKTRKLGFVAAKAAPHVLRDVNAFTLGARSVDPRVTTTVIFTNAWSAPDQEVAATGALAGKGVDVLAMYVNAPRALLAAAEARGLWTVGVHVDGTRHAPKGYLTGAEWRWARMLPEYVGWVKSGKQFPHFLRGGLREGFVDLSPFGPAVPQKVREQAGQARARLVEGTLAVWKGPLKDNTGRIVVPAGQEWLRNDVQLELAAFLVEGVVGRLPE